VTVGWRSFVFRVAPDQLSSFGKSGKNCGRKKKNKEKRKMNKIASSMHAKKKSAMKQNIGEQEQQSKKRGRIE
jgi:hypothetical protein